MANGWGQGTWGAVGWGGIGNTSFSVTGVAGTSAVGDEGATGTSTVIETGLEATSSLGTVIASSIHIITVSGVQSTATLNSATASIPISFGVTGLEATTGFLSGWGSSAWGDHIWGGGVFADVGQTITPTGFEAQAQLTLPTITGTGIFSVTGVQGVTSVGDEATTPQSRVSVTQSGLTGSVGNTTETGTALSSPTGVSATTLIAQKSTSTITFTVTVVGGNPSNHPYHGVGSANKFAINGSTATADVTLNLYETNTYRFDQSHSSNDGHPLRLSTTENGTHGGGSEYTTGVTTNGTPGQAGAYTEITVVSGAPDLHYYCTNHPNIGYFAYTPFIGPVLIGTTGAPVTNVTALTSALGNETVIGSAGVALTLAGMSISINDVAISGGSVLSLTGVVGTTATGEEQVYSLIEPDQLANWIERVA